MEIQNITTASYAAETTTGFLMGKYIRHNISPWIHVTILILGLITNPMILIVLRKRKIGSEYPNEYNDIVNNSIHKHMLSSCTYIKLADSERHH